MFTRATYLYTESCVRRRTSYKTVPKNSLSRDRVDQISLNFPDSKIFIIGTICASLGEFLCAKLEILLQTQEDITTNLEIFYRV